MVLTSKFLLIYSIEKLLSLTIVRVDLDLNCIKGGGACQLREKVLAEAANTCVHDYI
jgi:hypothetical protein